MKQHAFALACIRCASIALGIGGTALAAMLAGQKEFGLYSFVISALFIVSIPSQLGLPQLLLRELSRYGVSVGNSPGTDCYRWTHKVLLYLTIICIGVLGVYAMFIAAAGEWHLYALAALALPLVGLSSLRTSALRAIGKPVLAQVPELVAKPLVFVSALAMMALLIGPGLDASLLLLAQIASLGVATGMGVWYINRRTPLRVGYRSLHEVPAQQNWRLAIVSLGLLSGLKTVEANSAIFILGSVATYRDVAVYRVYALIASYITFGLQTANMVYAQKVGHSLENGNVVALRSALRDIFRISTTFGVVATAGVLLFAGTLIPILFGQEYTRDLTSLYVLCTSYVLTVIFGPVGVLIKMARMERKMLSIALIGLSTNVLLNLALIPIMGLMGSCLAALISSAFWNVATWIAINRRIPAIATTKPTQTETQA